MFPRLKFILYDLFYMNNGRLVITETRYFKVCLIKLLNRLKRFNISVNIGYINTKALQHGRQTGDLVCRYLILIYFRRSPRTRTSLWHSAVLPLIICIILYYMLCMNDSNVILKLYIFIFSNQFV